MNLIQYQLLCKYCDDILQENDSSLARIAIPWLHVIRPHPIFLSQYEELFLEKFNIKIILRKILRNIINKIVILTNFIKTLARHNLLNLELKKGLKNTNILFISHLIDLEKINSEIDSYFGTLPNTLENQGYTVVVALINHTVKSTREISKHVEIINKSKLILLDTLSFRKELSILKKINHEKKKLKLILNAATGLKRKILTQLMVEIDANGTSRALRINLQVKELVKQYNINTIVTTYEGHSWERLAFAGARESNAKIKCIGYMHAPLFYQQHSLSRELEGKYNPNQVWTVNHAIAEFLKLKIKSQINSIGSDKYNKDQSEYRHNLISEKEKVCLVIPEGIISECDKLFNFSLECAIKDPSMNFIWRLHPILSFSDLMQKNKKFYELPKNISLSKGSLSEDISRSSYALYRGSSAIIECIVGNLMPIYLDVDGEIIIDPLYQLDIVIKIKTAEDYFSVVNGYQFRKKDNFKIINDYCRNYYEPLDISAINLLI